MKRSLVALLAVSLMASLSWADAPSVSKNLNVEKIAVGTAIDNKELSGTGTDFQTSINRVYCWTRITATNPPVQIKHIWYADGKKEAEIPLDIKYASVRTWSNKAVWPGQWRVDVTTDSGEVLSSMEFKVQEGAK